VRPIISFLRGMLALDDVRAGQLDTGLIERLPAIERPPVDETARAAAALLEHAAAWRRGSPWAQPSGFRLGAHRAPRYFGVEVLGAPDRALVDGIQTRFSYDGTSATIEYLGVSTTYRWARAKDALWLHGAGRTHEFELRSREQRLAQHRATLSRAEGVADPEVRSAMPGTVVALATATGSVVEAGAALLTIEAMKMEHTMLASIAGVVTLTVTSGDQVRTGQVVARIDPHEGAAA
jgi:acetyl-CoA/propionyl-CoA carboxylase biotin carboxyl carrier protein